MPIQQDLHLKHKKHRNVLYSLVILLTIIHIVSFSLISIQVSKLSVKIDSDIEKTKEDSKAFTENLVETYDSLYQTNFQEISTVLSRQQQEFEQEITLLKSPALKGDFSELITQSTASIGTVRAGNSIGTYFIIHEEGYLVTNHHVIESSPEDITVLTYSREIIPAELISADSTLDLALLKIPGKYDALPLADSTKVKVGEKVIAIGNPLGLSFTVTEGIVSAVKRPGPNGLGIYVQTDVSLNQGNSGGPLINTQGEVVGMNNFKVGGSEGLGFAIEADAIKDFVEKSISIEL
jgi:S1-C subfamily serine protease